jgi:MarR family transcriptional regulator, organic hydroperoxide resistance regulator
MRDDARAVLDAYPRIYFACHRRHVRDPESGRVLSAHQASILDHLDEVESTTLAELARHMGVTASTMSLGIERLVRGGYVARERDPADRRRLELRLTEAGVRIRNQQSVLEPALVEAMLDRLSIEEHEDVLRGLRLLAKAADGLRASVPREPGSRLAG